MFRFIVRFPVYVLEDSHKTVGMSPNVKPGSLKRDYISKIEGSVKSTLDGSMPDLVLVRN